MVYRGRASRGCEVCRRRRIKCDLTPGGCRRCAKLGRACPGYRSEVELMFCNKTADDLQKDNLRAGGGIKVEGDKKENAERALIESTVSRRQRSSALRTPVLLPSLTERAVDFFFQHYASNTLDSNPFGFGPRGDSEYLSILYSRSSPGGMFTSILEVVALASFANAGNVPGWKSQVFKLYGTAISKMKDALMDPVQVRTDEMLAAVMLMGTFEAIIGRRNSYLKDKSYHIIAAGNLIDLRGPQQFESQIAIRLFLQIRQHIVSDDLWVVLLCHDSDFDPNEQLITCHQLNSPVPFDVHKWERWIEPYLDPADQVLGEFTNINVHLSNVRSHIVQEDITDPKEAMALLLPIDEMLQQWENQLPSSWRPTTCNCPLQPNSVVDCLTPECYIYQDLWSASIWNNYRCVRILIHNTILSLSNVNPDQPDINVQSSLQIIHEMTMDICRSVPFYLGHRHLPTTDNTSVPPQLTSWSFQSPNTGAYLIMWPLYMAGLQPTMTATQRHWIGRKLGNIGVELGVRLAFSLGKNLISAQIKRYKMIEASTSHKLRLQGGDEEEASNADQPELYDEI